VMKMRVAAGKRYVYVEVPFWTGTVYTLSMDADDPFAVANILRAALHAIAPGCVEGVQEDLVKPISGIAYSISTTYTTPSDKPYPTNRQAREDHEKRIAALEKEMAVGAKIDNNHRIRLQAIEETLSATMRAVLPSPPAPKTAADGVVEDIAGTATRAAMRLVMQAKEGAHIPKTAAELAVEIADFLLAKVGTKERDGLDKRIGEIGQSYRDAKVREAQLKTVQLGPELDSTLSGRQ